MRRCLECSLVFTYPQPESEQVAARYSGHWFEGEYLPSYGVDPRRPNIDHLAPRFDRKLDTLERFRASGRILDVGAGAGLFLARAAQRGWSVSGVELSDFGPRFAKANFGLDIFCGTLEAAAFPDKHFDVVILQDTIEHVPDPAGMLREIRRILRTGGALVISTPNFDALGRIVTGDDWALISPAEHLFLFSRRSLRRALEQAGFRCSGLRSSAGLNPDLQHRPRMLRRLVLRFLSSRPVKPVLALLGAGDELFCTAVKA